MHKENPKNKMNTRGRKMNNQYFHMSIKQVLSFVPYMTRQLTVAHSQQRAYLSTTQSKPEIPELNETLLLADTMKLPMTHLII